MFGFVVLLSAVYLFLKGEDQAIGARLRLISPSFPALERGVAKCLRFEYKTGGAYVGSLHVLDEFGHAQWNFYAEELGGRFLYLCFEAEVLCTSRDVTCMIDL